jgi:hypothetical protein
MSVSGSKANTHGDTVWVSHAQGLLRRIDIVNVKSGFVMVKDCWCDLLRAQLCSVTIVQLFSQSVDHSLRHKLFEWMWKSMFHGRYRSECLERLLILLIVV